MLKVHINHLPNECLTIIFKNLTLQNMLCIRITCPRWMGVIEAICERKRCLDISKLSYRHPFKKSEFFSLKTDDYLKTSNQDRLAIKGPNFTSTVCDTLGRLFPNLEQLIFPRYLLRDDQSPELTYLLQQWPALATFALCGSSNWARGDKVNISKNVAQAMRKLSSIKSLYIYCSRAETSLPSKIIPKLDHLFLGAEMYYMSFLKSLARLKPTCQIRLFIYHHYHSEDSSYKKIEKLINECKHIEFASKVTHLRYDRVDLDKFRFISTHFTNLQYLDLTFRCIVSISCNIM